MGSVVVVENVWGASLEDLAKHHEVRWMPKAWSNQRELSRAIENADALIVRNRTDVTKELLERATQLKVIGRAGVGLDNIDLKAANELGKVIVAPIGANAVSVAEHSLALALAVCRDIVPRNAEIRRGAWNRWPGLELAGGTWGLLSAGSTGRETARLARAIGMTVVAYDPYLDAQHPELVELDIKLMSLKSVVEQADVLSVHLPASVDTAKLVDKTVFDLMKPTAVFVNVGRGEVVDEAALAEALSEKKILGAGIDVRVSEPPDPDDDLLKLDNVVFSPHIAGVTVQSQDRIINILCENIDQVLNGKIATNAVGDWSMPGGQQ